MGFYDLSKEERKKLVEEMRKEVLRDEGDSCPTIHFPHSLRGLFWGSYETVYSWGGL